MNIALLVMTCGWGGAERHTMQLARILGARGHKPTVVCLTDLTYELYRQRGAEQISLAYLPLPEPTASIFKWLGSFDKQSWDVCILVKCWFEAADWRLDLVARLLFRRFLTIEHLTGDPNPEKTSRRHFGVFPGLGLWWYRQWFPKFFRSIGPRKVICVSDAVRSRLIDDYCFPAHKVITVCNGIDVQQFQRDPAARKTWRRRWEIPADALVLGAVGRLAKIKGYDTAMVGFQALLKRFPEKDLRLVLVGEGPDDNALQEMASQILPDDRVVFSPFCERPWEVLSALDVFLMPSINEGLPLALVEAMACGCCPVAMAVGGVPEVVSSPKFGWVVPRGNTEAFIAAMVDAASRATEERAVIGKRAREHVAANFDAAVQFNLLADVIESCTRESSLRSPPVAMPG